MQSLNRSCFQKLSRYNKDGKDLTRADGWRPINLLPAWAKVWEKAIIYTMCAYLNISEYQFAYLAHKGCEDLLRVILDHDKVDNQKKKWVVELFLDMSRAFERVCITKLKTKMIKKGLPP